jgi:hypothetical protein
MVRVRGTKIVLINQPDAIMALRGRHARKLRFRRDEQACSTHLRIRWRIRSPGGEAPGKVSRRRRVTLRRSVADSGLTGVWAMRSVVYAGLG